MKEFIYDMFIYPFEEWSWNILLGVFMWILALLVIFLISWGSLYLIDSVGLEERHGEGIIVNKWFEPEHTETILVYNAALKQSMPQIRHYDDTWKVKIAINGITDIISVFEEDYNQLDINQKVNCTYEEGRIWDSIYISGILW